MTTIDFLGVTMRSHSFIWKETGIIALGQSLCVALMTGIFALIGRFDLAVVLGGLTGGLVSTANFFFMSLFANLAADKAEQQDVAGGQKLVQLSYIGRLIAMFVILALCAKSGYFHVLTLVLPLAFTRPILTVAEFIRKKGERKS